jgi:hypothetical protein
MMEDWKEEETYWKLAVDAMLDLETHEVLQVLMQWQEKKISDAGGQAAWDALGPEERATRDLAAGNAMLDVLGRERFESLPEDEKRALKLFLWAGCGMHKEQNTFKAGCHAMNAAWERLSLPKPYVLANKSNADKVKKALSPERGDKQLTEDELEALISSAFGGAKLAALAGTIYRNKDDKKGQGDSHRVHFSDQEHFRPFPETHNSRFGSFGEAAGELILHLKQYIHNLEAIIQYRKQNPGLTNIELNVLHSLRDIPTLTELVIMSVYHETVAIPVLEFIQGSKTNALDLKEFYSLVVDHCQKAIDDPSLFLEKSADAFKQASLDGKEWRNTHIMEANWTLIPDLPQIVTLFQEFFIAAKACWIRFTAEFAPGSAIDIASDQEHTLCWMPTTNDINEGALGSFRVFMRYRLHTTLHQFNAIEMFNRNETGIC